MSIIVQGVTKLYGTQKALDNISFEVKTGEIVGFLGPNGAGKSTMMKIITGFLPASSGKVFVNDLKSELIISTLSVRSDTCRKTILYTLKCMSGNTWALLLQFTKQVIGKRQIDRIIELTGLAPEQKKLIGSLSKGYRQRVGLAQALIHNPAVLILDEATTGLDPNQIVEIRNLIREAGKEKTVLLSTHIMQEVEAICERVIIIDKGIIVANEEKSNIYSVIKQAKQIIEVEFDKNADVSKLTEIQNISRVRLLRNNTWQVEAEGDEDIRPAIFNFAVANNLTVLSLQKQQSNLEEVFRHLTS